MDQQVFGPYVNKWTGRIVTFVGPDENGRFPRTYPSESATGMNGVTTRPPFESRVREEDREDVVRRWEEWVYAGHHGGEHPNDPYVRTLKD